MEFLGHALSKPVGKAFKNCKTLHWTSKTSIYLPPRSFIGPWAHTNTLCQRILISGQLKRQSWFTCRAHLISAWRTKKWGHMGPRTDNATRLPMGVTAATWCAVAEATTPTWTKWWSVATANTTGAAMWPAKSVRGLSRDMCANENPPLPTWELRWQWQPSTIQRTFLWLDILYLVDTDLKRDGRRKSNNHTGKNKNVKEPPEKQQTHKYFPPPIKCCLRRQNLIWDGIFFQNISYGCQWCSAIKGLRILRNRYRNFPWGKKTSICLTITKAHTYLCLLAQVLSLHLLHPRSKNATTFQQ